MTLDDGARRRELARFLRDRRARVGPGDVGLPAGGRRRVAGLRREEVATLAGVGVTWYTMLESGTAHGVSLATLERVGTALRLSADERAYLEALASGQPFRPPHVALDDVAAGALAAVEWAPAYAITTNWDVLAWNRAMSLVWGIELPGEPPFNIARRMFRDAAVRALHGEHFESFARRLVGMLRAGKARRIEDPAYRALCNELQSDAVFAAAWAAYDVAAPLSAMRTVIESRAVGTFAYETLTLVLPGEAGHAIVVQVPDAPSAARLRAALAGEGRAARDAAPSARDSAREGSHP